MRQNQEAPPVNMVAFHANYVPGRDYLIKPYALPDEVPDHPSQLPTPGKRVNCYECGYCQFSSLSIQDLATHCRDAKMHPYKFGETGVHPELVDVHPKLVERHQEKAAKINGVPADVDEYDEVAAVKANTAFVEQLKAARSMANKPAPTTTKTEVKG